MAQYYIAFFDGLYSKIKGITVVYKDYCNWAYYIQVAKVLRWVNNFV